MINGFQKIKRNIKVLNKSELNFLTRLFVYLFPESDRAKKFEQETEVYKAHAEHIQHFFQGKRFKQAVETANHLYNFPTNKSYLPTLAENGKNLIKKVGMMRTDSPDEKLRVFREEIEAVIKRMKPDQTRAAFLETLLLVSAEGTNNDQLGAVYDLIMSDHDRAIS